MEVVQSSNAAEWLRRAETLLLADEARHNLILGIAGDLRDHPGRYAECVLWLVEDAGEVLGAALRTPPHNLVVARAPEAAITALAESIRGDLPGVVGAVPEVGHFVAARHARAQPRARQGIYALRELVQPLRRAAGTPRPATRDDRPLLLEWWGAFAAEALGENASAEGIARNVDHRLTARPGGIDLWEDDGRPVSLVAFGSPTPNGMRIGPVYTPPKLRGRGYASSLTAHVSAAQLASGRAFCFLYTDLANPTSNKIYTKLGYERVCDSVEYAFV